MNKIKYYVVIMCLPLIGACIGPEEIKHTKIFEEEGFNRGNSILPIKDGYILTGFTIENPQIGNIGYPLIVKTDRGGNEKWQKVYGDKKHQISYSRCDDNGGSLVTGMTRTKDKEDLLVIKIE